MPPIDELSWEVNAKYLIDGMEKNAIKLEEVYGMVQRMQQDIAVMKDKKETNKYWVTGLLTLLAGAIGAFFESFVLKR